MEPGARGRCFPTRRRIIPHRPAVVNRRPDSPSGWLEMDAPASRAEGRSRRAKDDKRAQGGSGVWVYDKDSGNQRFDSIKNATVRRVIAKDLEEQKGIADGVVSRLVKSIERDPNIDSVRTHRELCGSAMYLWICGLPTLQDIDDRFQSAVDLVDGTLKAEIDGRAWMAPQAPGGYGSVNYRDLVVGMVQSCLSHMIQSCSSHFLMAGGRASFVTSDRIVALEGRDGGVGIGNFATATFPFTPRLAIQIRAGGPSLFRRPAEILDDASVRRINRILMDRASRFIVSDSRITAKPAQRVTRVYGYASDDGKEMIRTSGAG